MKAVGADFFTFRDTRARQVQPAAMVAKRKFAECKKSAPTYIIFCIYSVAILANLASAFVTF